MSLFTIDQDKCKRDRVCASECPVKLIEFTDKDSFPSPITDADERCLICGHCVAVCPHGAISLKTVASDSCPPINKDLIPSAEQMEMFLKSRRSIRSFRSKPVDHAILEKLIDISRYAPSGHNSEPVHWMVVEDKDTVHRLAGLVADWMRIIIANVPALAAELHFADMVTDWDQGIDRILRGAPHVILAYAPTEARMGQGSCQIALTYLEMAAYSMGLGACWAGFLTSAASFPSLLQELALPEGNQVFGAMMIGYPKYSYHRIPPRKPARIIWR